MLISPSERLVITSNVWLTLRDDAGRVVETRESHNVFINQGRQWLRNLCGAAVYPASVAAETNCTGAGDGSEDSSSINLVGPVRKTYKVRWVGCGVGGVLQTIAPPGPGVTQEVATTTQLERPVQVVNPAAAQWLKEVLPQSDVADTQIFPSDYSIRFRAIFGKNDLSFATQPTYGTNVPISEVALFTSEAGRDVDPAGAGGTAGKVGCIAYHCFAPISKTNKFTLELAWSLDY